MLMLLAEKWTPDSAGIAYLRGNKLRGTCGDGRLAPPVEQSETPDAYGQPPPIGAAIANVGATDAPLSNAARSVREASVRTDGHSRAASDARNNATCRHLITAVQLQETMI
jgi:hypothetical protein